MSLETPRPPPSSQLVSLRILPACQPAVYLPVIVCPCTGLPVRPYYLYVCEDLNLHICVCIGLSACVVIGLPNHLFVCDAAYLSASVS